MRDFDRTIIAKRICELRSEKEIGRKELAQKIQVSTSAVNYWENSQREPSAQAIYKLARYFDVTADYLLGIEND